MMDWIQKMKELLEINWNQHKWYFLVAGAAIVLLAVLVLT
jgi:hypothetical protein